MVRSYCRKFPRHEDAPGRFGLLARKPLELKAQYVGKRVLMSFESEAQRIDQVHVKD